MAVGGERERQDREREKGELFSLLVRPAVGYSSQGWARLMPGTSPGLPCEFRAQVLERVLLLAQVHLQSSGLEVEHLAHELPVWNAYFATGSLFTMSQCRPPDHDFVSSMACMPSAVMETRAMRVIPAG